jgi:hypothetical protein
MQCEQCGELQVTPDPVYEARRHRAARIVAWLGAVCFFVASIIDNCRGLWSQALSTNWCIFLILLVGATVLFSMICRCAVEVILPGDARKRFEAAMTGVFFLAFFLLAVVAFAKVGVDLRSLPSIAPR